MNVNYCTMILKIFGPALVSQNWNRKLMFAAFPCHSVVVAEPRSPSTCEEKPAASEESEASEMDDTGTPAAGEADSAPGKRKRKRKRKKKKKKMKEATE